MTCAETVGRMAHTVGAEILGIMFWAQGTKYQFLDVVYMKISGMFYAYMELYSKIFSSSLV